MSSLEHQDYTKLVADAEAAVDAQDHAALTKALKGAANEQTFQVMHHAIERRNTLDICAVCTTILTAADPNHRFNHYSSLLFELAIDHDDMVLMELILERIDNDRFLTPAYNRAIDSRHMDALNKIIQFIDDQDDPAFAAHFNNMLGTAALMQEFPALRVIVPRSAVGKSQIKLLCDYIPVEHADILAPIWETMTEEHRQMIYDKLQNYPKPHTFAALHLWQSEQCKAQLSKHVDDTHSSRPSSKM